MQNRLKGLVKIFSGTYAQNSNKRVYLRLWFYVNNMAALAASEKFMAQYLGGRFQESMTDEVAKRLKEITVDIKTVQKPATVIKP